MSKQQLFFKPRKSHSQAEFKSVRRMREEVARNHQSNIQQILGNRANLFVPFVNERINGKLVTTTNLQTRPTISILDRDYESCQFSSKLPEVDNSPNKWTLNGVTTSRKLRTPRTLLSSQQMGDVPNVYAKSNMAIFKEIRKLEPPESVPNEDRGLVKSLYDSYKKIKEFNVNTCRRHL